MMHYDYIITGGGCAGLSLLVRMVASGGFKGKKILLVDKDAKKSNDRTWCFWEKKAGLFESIVYKSWDRLYFHGENFDELLNIAPYRYKMVRGIDFYEHAHRLIANTGIDIETGSIDSISNHDQHTEVRVNKKTYTADYVFNSVLLQKPDLSRYYSLQQHFKGWFVRSRQPFFDPAKATLMDFRVGQQHGTTFVYVLPFDAHRALVEYTLFTRDLLAPDEYNQALAAYMTDLLGLSDYQIEEEEFGVIPMTNFPFPAREGRIIHMGTAGGQTKASSGYTFQYIQKHTTQLVEALLRTGSPVIQESWPEKRFAWYDSTLLHVLDKRKMEGKKIFTNLFSKGDPQRVFQFLDNETTLLNDFAVMNRLPKITFAKAALQELIS